MLEILKIVWGVNYSFGKFAKVQLKITKKVIKIVKENVHEKKIKM